LAQHSDIAVFPNPANDYVEISFSSEISGKASVQLLDMSGRIVLQESIEVTEGQNNAGFDISELSTGIYMMNLVQDQAVSRFKIVVE
jgi:hypothetical protein